MQPHMTVYIQYTLDRYPKNCRSSVKESRSSGMPIKKLLIYLSK